MSLPLSLSEVAYHRSGFGSGIRVDGRIPTQRRESLLSVNTLRHTPGSASITIDGTSVLVAIQANAPSAKTIRPEDVATKCALLQELLTSAYASMQEFPIGLSAGYWHLNADVMILHDAGNIFEAAFNSLAAALSSTRLPKSIDGAGGIYPEDLVPLSIVSFPSFKYAILISNILATDPTLEEESISDSQLFLTRSSDNTISSIRKLGKGLLSFEQLITLACSD